jgi:hypothetical protein
MAGAMSAWARSNRQLLFGYLVEQSPRSRGANIADGSDPSFGHVADLIACHGRKVISKEEPKPDGRRASFRDMCDERFKITLALVGRVLNIKHFESGTNQQSIHLIRCGQMTDRRFPRPRHRVQDFAAFTLESVIDCENSSRP